MFVTQLNMFPKDPTEPNESSTSNNAGTAEFSREPKTASKRQDAIASLLALAGGAYDNLDSGNSSGSPPAERAKKSKVSAKSSKNEATVGSKPKSQLNTKPKKKHPKLSSEAVAVEGGMVEAVVDNGGPAAVLSAVVEPALAAVPEVEVAEATVQF